MHLTGFIKTGMKQVTHLAQHMQQVLVEKLKMTYFKCDYGFPGDYGIKQQKI